MNKWFSSNECSNDVLFQLSQLKFSSGLLGTVNDNWASCYRVTK